MDPLADQYADQGTGSFAGNDPVNKNDPTGAFISDENPGARGQDRFRWVMEIKGNGGSTGYLGDGGPMAEGRLNKRAFAQHDARIEAHQKAKEAKKAREEFMELMDRLHIPEKLNSPNYTSTGGRRTASSGSVVENIGTKNAGIKIDNDQTYGGVKVFASKAYVLRPGHKVSLEIDGAAVAGRPGEIYKITNAFQGEVYLLDDNVMLGSRTSAVSWMYTSLNETLYDPRKEKSEPGGWYGQAWNDQRHREVSPLFPHGFLDWDALFQYSNLDVKYK